MTALLEQDSTENCLRNIYGEDIFLYARLARCANYNFLISLRLNETKIGNYILN